jgi:hypothetical protein
VPGSSFPDTHGHPLKHPQTEPPDWQTVVNRVSTEAKALGFDLIGAARLEHYQPGAPKGFQLPCLSDDLDLVVLLGNTKVLWPHFKRALQQQSVDPEGMHPFDDWVTKQVEHLTQTLPWASAVRYAHAAPPKAVAIQHLAARVGLAHLGPAGLSVHAKHGPWVSWRAALIFGIPGPESPPNAPDPCNACQAPCVPALEKAMAYTSPHSAHEHGASWHRWLAVRDACPIGHLSRFPPDQVRYHYGKDRETLRAFAMVPSDQNHD